MSTAQMIQTAGTLPVLLTLVLTLVVTLLRLAALPLAVTALALDTLALLAARPLSLPAPAPQEATR